MVLRSLCYTFKLGVTLGVTSTNPVTKRKRSQLYILVTPLHLKIYYIEKLLTTKRKEKQYI